MAVATSPALYRILKLLHAAVKWKLTINQKRPLYFVKYITSISLSVGYSNSLQLPIYSLSTGFRRPDVSLHNYDTNYKFRIRTTTPMQKHVDS